MHTFFHYQWVSALSKSPGLVAQFDDERCCTCPRKTRKRRRETRAPMVSKMVPAFRDAGKPPNDWED